MGRNLMTLPKLGAPRIQYKPMGDWAGTIRRVQGLSKAIKESSLKAQLKVCKEIQKKVKAHLRNNDLGWRGLGPSYSLAKQQAGLDGRTLIAYGTYYHSIEVWQKGTQHMAFVGVKKGIYTKSLRGKRSKLDVATIAAIHEFSSGKRIPRRPLWNPTLREMGGAAGIKKMYTNSLYYWLRLKGVPIKKLGKLF